MGNCMHAGARVDSYNTNPSRPAAGPLVWKTTSSSATSSDSKHSSASNIGSSFSPSASESSGGGVDAAFPDGRILAVPNLRIYTFSEMKTATKNFKPDSVLGEGGFGRVYKGWVDEKTLNPTRSGTGIVVAVKKLSHESLQGLEEWQSEVNFLGRLSHPNLVRLLGYCWEEAELLLVYEFLAKGSLANHLFRRSAEPLSWELRLKIAIGAAKGLAFLHTSDNRQVIYRDFKASNILLDSNYNAKLSDFGLAKLGPSASHSHVTTRVMGTSGYAAPEYMATGHLYVKSDVYGFGVVLLEMLSGQRALDANRPPERESLVGWAKPLLSDRRRLPRLMDPRLKGQYRSKEAFLAAQLAFKCLAVEPKSRPSMKEVVEKLQQIEDTRKTRIKEAGRDCQQPWQLPGPPANRPSPVGPHANACRS